LFWSGLFFAVVTINNLLLVADKLVFHIIDLSVLRYIIALAAHGLLLFGLISESK